MKNGDPQNSQREIGKESPQAAPDIPANKHTKTSIKATKNAKQGKNNKWTLSQHWQRASSAKRFKWIAEGAGGLIALLVLGNYIWGNLQTESNFREARRPDIVITKFEIMDPVSGKRREQQEFQVGEPLEINVDFKNIGSTDAVKFMPRYHVLFGESTSLLRPDAPEVGTTEETVDAGSGEHAVTAVSLIDEYARPDAHVNPADLVNWDGSQPIYVFGRLAYQDSFGTKYCTPFIVQYLPGNWGSVAKVNTFSKSDMCPKN